MNAPAAGPNGPGKTVQESRVVLSQLMMPQHANQGGTVFGGVVVSVADTAAYACAARHAGAHCVTVAIDRVDFHEPIRIGELVTFEASVRYAGRTSMEIGIEIYAENFVDGKRRHTNSCHFTMVHLGPDGRPAPVPALLTETPEEKRLAEEARRSREAGRGGR